jgi:hypothetical protein
MERLRRMTTIAKKPRQSEETNKILFEKLDKLSNLEWAKWGGWFDSDGSFSFDKQKQLRAALQLSDKSPVQMFADTFEINLLSSNRRTNYEKSTGTNSEKFSAYLTRARAVYFCKKVHPYIINKNNHLNNVLAKANIKINDGYLTMSDEEFFVWLVSFMEGDGCFAILRGKTPVCKISSNNKHLLNYIKDRCTKLKLVNFTDVYLKQKAGTTYMSSTSNVLITRKDGYVLNVNKKSEIKPFYEKILPYMTLDKKKQKVIESLNIFK